MSNYEIIDIEERILMEILATIAFALVMQAGYMTGKEFVRSFK